MPDASPAGGHPTAADQPTTDLSRVRDQSAPPSPPASDRQAGAESPPAPERQNATAGPPPSGRETGTASRPAIGRQTAGAASRAEAGTSETTAAGDQAGFRLAAFGALLVVVLFAGYGLGRLNNGATSASAPPAGTAADGSMAGMVMDENQPHTHNADGTTSQTATGQGPTGTSAGAAVGGLSLSSGGLTLVPSRTTFLAGRPQRLAFRIIGAGGAPVTTYQVVHDKLLHLIVIRRDLSGFQHLHPAMAADGTWSIDLTLAGPGIYRMIADFTALVGGAPVATTLGSDLTVAGDYAPARLPAPTHAVATDGFAVGYEGAPSVRSTQPILISVAGADRQPAVLEPYLGAYGHLVVLRQGDLAYVHVHPEATLVDGKVKFWLSVPSEGVYRMFFDFQVAGKVHTAAWTMTV
ncbi:hypothetical protein [Paractinoplanes globisporus]|uniref:Secreted protein n=1 Tax=Paractinoplanes globisporus TaxID=113565 RepID=A0ABW6WGF8_9ACTN|nr:hypothetical protein [Actinoplanes globisporus]